MLRTESQADVENPTHGPDFFDQQPRWRIVVLVILFLLAGAVRLYRIKAPGVLIDREYLSAIIARDFYFAHVTSIEEWRKEIAHVTRQNQPTLEPPITEFLVYLIYQALGQEQLWYSGLLTSAFWLVGGVFLYKIAKKFFGTGAALFATAYYLFLPLSILLSRNFQPDSLMMMLFLMSLFSIVRYAENSSDFNLVAAGGLSGLTLLCRPLVLFALLGAFIALAIHKKGDWKRSLDKRFLTFIALSLFPTILYYGYGLFVAGFLRWQVETSFRPDLLLHREFWQGWLELAVGAVGYPALVVALSGVPLLRKGLPRAMLVGLGIGYVAFGLVFTLH
jgi:4-amino-4-deoxy-L-arabinose transferase-like glycosyltransferase